MITPSDHDQLVLRLYDRVGDPELSAMFALWPRAFATLGVHTMLIDARGGVVESSTDGEVEGNSPEYEAEWRDADPRMALAVAHPGRVLSDVHHIDPVAFERSDVYNAILRPFGVRYSLFGSLPLASGYVVAQAAMRGFDRGSYGATEIAEMERLWPHVRRAFELRLELSGMRAQVSDLHCALDVMPSPVFVLDARGRIQHFNAAAERVLAARNAVFCVQGRLVASRPHETALLRTAIAAAIQYADGVTPDAKTPGAVVSVARARGRALSLVVHPIRPRVVLRSRTEQRARVLIVVDDPDARAGVDRELLARIYGLTPTESALAAAIAEGHTLAEFADSHGCTEATARVHLKRIFEKTGTTRQPELVHRILVSAALHRIES